MKKEYMAISNLYENDKSDVNKALSTLKDKRRIDKDELKELQDWKEKINKEKQLQAEKEAEAARQKKSEEEKLKDQIIKANKIRKLFKE